MIVLSCVFGFSQEHKGINLKLLEKGSSTCSTKLTVKVKSGEKYFIEDKIVDKENLESQLLLKLKGVESAYISIQSDEDVQMKHVVFIMDIANKIKSALAVKAK